MEQKNETAVQEPQPEGKARRERRKMKKGWKITWITLASLAGVLLVAVVLVLWLVLTPARLTSIVNKLADKYVLCDTHFGNVDLTLLSTFPYVGLEVDDVRVVNPMEGAPSDTLASIDRLAVGVHLMEYLRHGNIEVTKLKLNNVDATLYTNQAGESNYDVFPESEPDTTPSEPFEMPELVSLKSIRIANLNATYQDEQNDLCAALQKMNLSIDGHYDPKNIDACVELDADRLALTMDTLIDTRLQGLAFTLEGDMKNSRLQGDVNLTVADGNVALDSTEYVNAAMRGQQGSLLCLEGRIGGDWEKQEFQIDDLEAWLKGYMLALNGSVAMASEGKPMEMDLNFATNSWGVDSLLAMLPEAFTSWSKGMRLDADAQLTGHVRGALDKDTMPLVTANLQLDNGRFSDHTILPYDLNSIRADIGADLDLNKKGVSSVNINKLYARSGRNHLSVEGHIDDLLGQMLTDAHVTGSIQLADLKPMLPDSLDMALDGSAMLNLNARTNLEQLQKSQFDRMRLNGTVGLRQLVVDFDSIHADIPVAKVDIQLPSRLKRGLFDELLSATVTASQIDADLPASAIKGTVGSTELKVAVSNIFDTLVPLRLVCDFDFAEINGTMDSIVASMSEPNGTFAMMPKGVNSDKVDYRVDFTSSALHCELNDTSTIDLAGLTIKGGAHYDPSKSNTLQQWSPNLDVDFKRGYIDLEQFDYMVQIPDIKFNYKPERCEISSANVVFGNSDFYLSGAVTGLEKWLSHEEMLRGDLYFTSNFTNVDDLMEALSGLGTDADTLEVQRQEDNVDTAAHPFIVPRDVDFTLHTRIKEAIAFENELQEVAGDVTIRDGVAVLNQVGFVCKAARMQLTGMYRTPRVNHIFVGLDFHLLDINIQELIDMIPYVDTLVPLLEDLEGNADFHLCAETYVNAFYKPKMSTLRGAAAITGQDLVVLDNKDIDRIAKLLQLKKWREDDSKIHVDSLDVAMTVFRKELEVYPFLLSLHKYQIVAEGRHNLDNNYDYHVELVQSPLPVRLAVDVLGTLPDLKFNISPQLRYKNLYRPARRSEVDNEVLRLKEMIRKSLEANVKDSTREYQGLESAE